MMRITEAELIPPLERQIIPEIVNVNIVLCMFFIKYELFNYRYLFCDLCEVQEDIAIICV